jgi:hypothetical protein
VAFRSILQLNPVWLKDALTTSLFVVLGAVLLFAACRRKESEGTGLLL